MKQVKLQNILADFAFCSIEMGFVFSLAVSGARLLTIDLDSCFNIDYVLTSSKRQIPGMTPNMTPGQ